VPTDWAKGIIVPILKGGDKCNPLNYRGITLLNAVAKVYARIIATRLAKWAEDPEQAGFRPKRSVMDNVFVLSECVKSRRGKSKRL
jgi:hypothetical protein